MLYNYSYHGIFREWKRLMPTFLMNFLFYGLLRMTDTIVLRNVQDCEAVTISSLCHKVYFVASAFLTGFTNALAVITLHHVVRGDYRRSTETLKITLGLSIVFSFICFFVFFFFSSRVVYMMEQPDHVSVRAVKYLPILGLSIIPSSFVMCVRKYLRGLAWLKSAMFINLFASFSHVILAYFFINGLFGFSRMGLLGLPWAIAVSHFLSLFVSFYFLYALYKRGFIVSSNVFQWDSAVLKALLVLGLPLSIELGGSYFYNNLINQMFTGRLGKEVNKVATLVRNLDSFFRNMCIAVSVVTSMLVGRAFSQGQQEALYRIRRVAYVVGICMGIVVVILFFLLYPLFIKLARPSLYENEDEMALVRRVVLLSLPVLFLHCFKLVGIGLLTGLSAGVLVCCITQGCYFFVGLSLNHLCYVAGWGLKGIFFSSCVSFLIIGVLCNYFFERKCRGLKV